MKLFKIAICVIAAAFAFNSCSSYKNIPYFQDLNDPKFQEKIKNYSPVIIQQADLLGINVTSRNPESSTIFNYNLTPINGGYTITENNPVVGYLVDENGEIHLPLIGSLKVAGLPTTEVRDILNQKLLTFYKDPVVNVRIINFKVSVFGDVLRPNVYTVQDERITITQAIALAGDLNITALRNNVLLIRDQDGVRQYIHIDLTSKNLFDSPYFYLKNRDEIYVQPSRTKYATVDRGYRNATLALSGLSIVAIILSAYIYKR